MISILYPEQDYTAADIAMRVQALSIGEGHSINVIPKHLGRNMVNVQKMLATSDIVLFLAHEPRLLDAATIAEINFLQQKNKSIVALVPETWLSKNKLPQNTKIYTYSNKENLTNTLPNLINSLSKCAPKSKKKEYDVFVLAAVLSLVIIFLMMLNNEKN